jgi:hypothetical protein
MLVVLILNPHGFVQTLLEANSGSSCGCCSCQGDSQKYREEDGVPSEMGLAVSLLV